MKSSRVGLKSRSYKDSVITRLREANKEPIANKADYRYVNLGEEIFPISVHMVETFNKSDRTFKRGMKKSYKKMMMKLERAEKQKEKDKENENPKN